MNLENHLRYLLQQGRLNLSLPGAGETALRHRALAGFAQEDVALARLIEAHTDAVAILAEAGRAPKPSRLYGVWASESPTHGITLNDSEGTLTGSKAFCSGVSLVDVALVTVRAPEHLLVEVDLRTNGERFEPDDSGWVTRAFSNTATGTANFKAALIEKEGVIGPSGWYLSRPGFWNGACGPAACWAGGATGLTTYARDQLKGNPHDIAHVAAMEATVWAMLACLDQSGREIDADPFDRQRAQIRALSLRHIIEQSCADILRRFGRVCGPRALAFDANVSRRYQEVELYIRQCHAEKDLEALGGIEGERFGCCNAD